MEAGELLQAGQAAWSSALSVGAILVTITSGYLVVAYVAGKDMTRPQVTIVNCLYALVFVFSLVSTLAFVMRATELMQVAAELSNQRISGPRPVPALLGHVLWLFVLAASLKFMWDIRHKTKER